MAQKNVLMLLSALLLVAGCVFDSSGEVVQTPTVSQSAALSLAKNDSGSIPAEVAYKVVSSDPPAHPATTCAHPAGWLPYQMQLNETVYSVAARANASAQDVLRFNCLTNATELGPGAWLYVPPEVAGSRPQTLLPLGISALVADPVVVAAGGTVNLTWQAQGPVVRVRLGWLYQNQFIEEAASLPPVGTWQLTAPADGRDAITFVVRASDGLQEVAAQTTVQIRCAESWFFSPPPGGCPTAPLVTTFHEQHFERGTIVYIPALGLHYMLIVGQPGAQVANTFVPGMPLKDAAIEGTVPGGLFQPDGPINYAWRSDETRRVALGYAIEPETRYVGMLQRMTGATGETVYLSASSGVVYRFVSGQAWQVIEPQ